MAMSMLSVLAQEESHIKSEVMNTSVEMRFKRGIFLTSEFLDDNGELVINENEAKVVKLIFFMYQYGYSSSEIAAILTKSNVKHVKKAAENFNVYQINPVKVSRRNDVNYVFNGQHTIEIIALVSRSRETPVWCMAYGGLYYEAEADIFANQLKYTKPLLPYEIFMANVQAGNDRQLIIKDLVESYGMIISPKPSIGGICAVSSLEFIYDKYGISNLQRALKLCIGTWEGEREAFSANILKEVALIVSEFENKLNDDLFKSKLGTVSIREITRAAAECRNGTSGYADAIMT